MIRDIQIGNKTVPMRANAATPIRYRQVFHKNLLPYFMGKASDEDAAEMVGELAYIMARSATNASMDKLSYEDYVSWLDDFEALDFVRDDTVSAIIDLYQGNEESMVDLKKSPGQLSDK